MHQGLPAQFLLLIALLFPAVTTAQLNTEAEIIETISDIPIEDDTGDRKQEETPYRPQFDEEFSTGKLPVQEREEEPEAEPELQIVQPPRDTIEDFDEELFEEGFGTADGPEKELPSYEDELQKNAEENQPQRREISPEDLKNFEVDPIIEQAQPSQEPQFEEQPVYYPPEPKGQVIVYENEKTLTNDQLETLKEKTRVEIEPDPFYEGTTSIKVGEYLKPFNLRRPSWTYQVEIGGSDYNPVNYISQIINGSGASFETFYEAADYPMPSFGLEFKKNFSWMAISLGLGGSYYLSTFAGAELEMLVPSAKLTVYLDTLFDEPYIVPYASAGYSYFQFNETDALTGLEYSGAADNFFVSAGVLFQLDWLDPIADKIAYIDNGIENTFIYAEMRTYLDSGIKGIYEDADVIGDFSSLTHFGAGVKVEF